MGSAISRHLRDLADVGGFEASNGPAPSPAPFSESGTRSPTEAESCPSTPTAHTPIRVLDLDPRSPTADIVRTPIEVSSKFSQRLSQDSPMVNVLHSRRSYLETDLDTLSTSETVKEPEAADEEGHDLPPGLSCAHLMKLRFLGIDPRSPSTSDVIRTPIQLGKSHQRDTSPIHFDDTLSVGSVSSYDIFSNSICSSEFTRDCSDPSAFISETEDLSDKEDELCVANAVEEVVPESAVILEDVAVQPSAPLKDKVAQNSGDLLKIVNKLLVFQEDEEKTETCDKTPSTPDGVKKPTGNRSRTPLTPICNRNRTPNSILRAKQSQTIEKEILTKAKIYSTDENILTPSKIRSFGSNKKENALNSRSSRKGNVSNNENNSTKKKVLAQWDHDNSVVI